VSPGQRLGLARVVPDRAAVGGSPRRAPSSGSLVERAAVELHSVTNVYAARQCAGAALKNVGIVRGAMVDSPTG
jgi:hypothetical protein